ncbi:MAG TPA: hypothetical protein VJT09_02845 [Pyrinomonadaceae bacterium]|nr:hypothetical protein [Pyrinomonadaceae bacterium]
MPTLRQFNSPGLPRLVLQSACGTIVAYVLAMSLACSIVTTPAKNGERRGAADDSSGAQGESLSWIRGFPGRSEAATEAQDERVGTTRAVIPKPPLPRLPRAGGKFKDPTFGTEIMRATDERDDPVGLSTYYSHWPTFNSDNTYLLVKKGLNGAALIKRFNSETFSVGPGGDQPGAVNVPGKGTVSVEFESAIWHPTDPNLIYCFPAYYDGGMRLYTYNVATRRYTLVKDFSNLGGPNDYLHQMSMSADGDVFAWSQVRSGRDDNPISYIVWRRSTDKVLYHTATGGKVNEVRVDKSGQYLAIGYNGTQPDKTRGAYLTLASGQVETIKWTPQDSPTGHGDLGTGFSAGWDNWASGINRRSLNKVHSPQLVFRFQDAKGTVDWTNDFHGSLLADNEDWITIGTYDDPSITLPETGIFEDEIMQVALDGSNRFRRICHTRSSIDNKTEASGYWAMPKPTISRDGRFIAFTSNWEKSGRFDVFIAKVAPAPALSRRARN